MIEQRVALITGGSRGIGRAICVEVAKAGYAVMINFNENFSAAQETQALVEACGVPADICQADVSAKSHRDLLVEYTMDRLGRIDLLVNNAGIGPPVRKDILETDEATYDRILNMNLKAPYFLSQRVAREMIELLKAKAVASPMIVNISSIRSYTAALNYGEYCISKAGVSMVTKLFAVRLAEFGINVYEICPGIIETDMTSSQATRDYYNGRLAKGMAPINRWGKPEEIGRAVAAIARGDFPFSTGAVFDVDGGWHLRHLQTALALPLQSADNNAMSTRTQIATDEKRRFNRDMTIGVTTMTQLKNGVILEGVVRDVSDGGIRISGNATGLSVGDSIDIVVVVNDQAVSYTCEVRHADADARAYGVAFQSRPRALQPPNRVKRCMRCGCDFPSEFQYCSQCGQRLVALTA